MNKKKIIYQILLTVGIAGVIIFALLGLKSQYKDDISFYTIWMGLSAVIWIWAYVVLEKIRDNEGPLALNKIKAALAYVIEHKQGTKDEFIKTHSEQLYNHLHEIGCIHQLRDNPRQLWEVTIRGEKISKEWE